MKRLLLNVCFFTLIILSIAPASARDARLDFLVNQCLVTEEQIAAAEMEGPNPWMTNTASDVLIIGLIQPRWTYTENADPENAFSIARARVNFSGTLGNNWGFVTQVELANTFDLLDAGIWLNVGNGTIRAGQFKIPFSQEWLTSSGELDTIKRSEIVDRVSIRDAGLFAESRFAEDLLTIQAAVTNGTGLNVAENNDEKDYWIRAIVSPFQGKETVADGLMIGAAYFAGEHQETDDQGVDLGDFDHSGWAATVLWIWESLKFQGEYIDLERDRGPNGLGETSGWYATVTYDFPLDALVVTPVIRYETSEPNTVAREVCGCNDGDWITLGVRVAWGGAQSPLGLHDVKIEINYILEDLTRGIDRNELIIQMTARF